MQLNINFDITPFGEEGSTVSRWQNIKIGRMERSLFYCPAASLALWQGRHTGRVLSDYRELFTHSLIITHLISITPATSLWLTSDYKYTVTVGWGNINSFLPHTIWIGYRHNESFVRVQERLANGWEKQHPINEQSETEFNWLKLHFMWW